MRHLAFALAAVVLEFREAQGHVPLAAQHAQLGAGREHGHADDELLARRGARGGHVEQLVAAALGELGQLAERKDQQPSFALQDGDRIQLGNVLLRFQMRAAQNRAKRGAAAAARR